MRLVMKFGGTSVGTVPAMRRTADLVGRTRERWPELVVVASALGTQPTKVTDMLLSGARAARAGDAATFEALATQLRQAHFEIIDGLLLPEGERQVILSENGAFVDRFLALCQAVQVLGELTPRALDAISGMGEQMSARILAALLRQDGVPAEAVDATELIRSDSQFQSANPLVAETALLTRARLEPLLARGVVPIVTGFIAADATGAMTTLGRGGSDYSAALLGQALSATEVWIWTDVDGVMTADPRLVSEARTIRRLTNREVSELAYYGARVLHPKTIRPVVENDIPLRIKNTFNPDHDGTTIVADQANGNGLMKAVTAIRELALVTVEGKGMLGVPGIAARTFGAVARSQANVLLISQASSEQSICFSIPLASAQAVIASLEAEFAAEIGQRDIDRVTALEPVGIVTMVGAGMRGTPGIAGRIFSVLGERQLNVIAIAQGSSECSISLVVADDDVADAVRQLHSLLG